MRKFNADERRLWDFVTRTVTPLKPRHPSEQQEIASVVADDALPPKHAPLELTPTPHRAPHHKPLHVGHLVDLDAATAKTFRKGRMPRDATLDLHGLTLAQAHSTLIHFVRSQSERGARCLLVITGKGAVNADSSRGRIKHELMHWLNAASLRPLVLAVTEANPKQSNGGAVYVLLKRRARVSF